MMMISKHATNIMHVYLKKIIRIESPVNQSGFPDLLFRLRAISGLNFGPTLKKVLFHFCAWAYFARSVFVKILPKLFSGGDWFTGKWINEIMIHSFDFLVTIATKVFDDFLHGWFTDIKRQDFYVLALSNLFNKNLKGL